MLTFRGGNIIRNIGRLFNLVRPFSQVPDIAFVLDIDGVLLRGSNALPTAKPALELLNKCNVPYILMTNGGGVKESDRVKFLSKKIDVPISPLQIVQSHTPMKVFANNQRNDRILVVGGEKDNARKCAMEYGFTDVIMPIDIVKAEPSISPFHNYTPRDFADYARDMDQINLNKAIKKILVFNDSRDLSSDCQIILDLLNSKDGVIGTSRNNNKINDLQVPSVPIVFSNSDFIWANDYKLPRFGQGALCTMIESLYKATNNLKDNKRLLSKKLGKPYKVQYDFAHHVLIDWRNKILQMKTNELEQVLPSLNEQPKNSPFKKIYMVGDNPASDIKGANDHGWESLLLRTGVYKDDDWNSIIAKPTSGVHDNILESVKYALHENRII